MAAAASFSVFFLVFLAATGATLAARDAEILKLGNPNLKDYGCPNVPISCINHCISYGYSSGICLGNTCRCIIFSVASAEVSSTEDGSTGTRLGDNGCPGDPYKCANWCISMGKATGLCNGNTCLCLG